MKCFYCSHQIENEFAESCPGCAKDLRKVCLNCKIEFEKGANFCMSCGGKLAELPEKKVEEEIVVLEEVTILEDPVPEPG